ncbi:hypothetical protein H9P43_005935 [Blastocladiella emersonii ATCC 22665]|nr:hypothetical protein H9P43_005935 [Blastocladiella emersonii ATCC 22665]
MIPSRSAAAITLAITALVFVPLVVMAAPASATTPTASAAAASKPTATPAPPVRLNKYGNNEFEETTLTEYASVDLLIVMCINLALTTGIVFTAARAALRARTMFHVGVLIAASLFLLNDISYFAVLAAHKAPNAFEIIRVLTPTMTSGLVSGLSLQRFVVFAATSHARWYTRRVRRALLAVNYLVLVVALALLVQSYFGLDLRQEVPVNPIRKITITAALAFDVLTDLVVTILIFRIVLNIRAALDSSGASNMPSSSANTNTKASLGSSGHGGKVKRRVSPEYRATVLRVLIAVVAMLVTSATGILVYYVSGGIVGDMIGAAFARIYVIAAMAEWYLVVDIVRKRGQGSSGNGSSSGGGAGTSYAGASMSAYNHSTHDPRSQNYSMKPIATTSGVPRAETVVPALPPPSPAYASRDYTNSQSQPQQSQASYYGGGYNTSNTSYNTSYTAPPRPQRPQQQQGRAASQAYF